MLTERSSFVLLTSKLDSSFTVEIPSTLVIKPSSVPTYPVELCESWQTFYNLLASNYQIVVS